MSKIHHMKKVYILGLDKMLVIKFKKVFLLLNMRSKLPLNLIYLVKSKRKIILVEWVWTKQMLAVNLMGKHITKRNTISENITYLVDNEHFLCQHEKLFPLTDRWGKWVSEAMYVYIEISHSTRLT